MATSTDGPILALLNRRIRNLKKKLKRIAYLEDGSFIIKNKEQEKLLESKPMIIAAVDELEKIRQPLSVAVDEEITLALQRCTHKDDEDCCNKPKKTLDTDDLLKSKPTIIDELETVAVDEEFTLALQRCTHKNCEDCCNKPKKAVDDLLSLIYLANMFDVKSESECNMLNSVYERKLCLVYDDSDLLTPMDLDMIALMASLLTTRGSSSLLSHQNALQSCIQHANLWLSKSQQQIVPDNPITYAGLREKLTKIMGLDWSIKTLSDDDVVAAVDRKSQIEEEKEMWRPENLFHIYDEGEQEPLRPWRPYQCPKGVFNCGRNGALCSLVPGGGWKYKILDPKAYMARLKMAEYDSD